MIIWDIASKDLTRSFRSAFAVGMAVAAPLMLIGLIYFAFGGVSSSTGDPPAFKVGVVNADQLPADVPLVHSLGDDIRSLFVLAGGESGFIPSDFADEAAARAAVDQQDIGVAVIIPKNFTERFLAGKADNQVLIISDPTLIRCSPGSSEFGHYLTGWCCRW